MHSYTMPSYPSCTEALSKAESLDESFLEENFFEELIDAVNQNFVLEVEASLAREDAKARKALI